MSVNGVTSSQASEYSYSATESTQAAKTAETTTETKANAAAAADKGVVYEPSNETATTPTTKTYKPDVNLINKIKADADARTSQLRSLVEKMMTGQATAYGKANDMWSILSSGKFTVDAATRAQAQADIAEDGYWGVNQTSDRILDFAKALTGGNPDKIEEMRSAFEKGFKRAGKTWGGNLPDISQRTYDAVMKKFDQWAEESKKAATVTEEDPTK